MRIRHGDGALGWPEHAPYDGIIISAASEEVPERLLDQLASDGRLVMPLGSGQHQTLISVQRNGAGVRAARAGIGTLRSVDWRYGLSAPPTRNCARSVHDRVALWRMWGRRSSRSVSRIDPVATGKPDEHTVRKGDTLYAIAWEHDLDYRDLAAWNTVEHPFVIYPGQVLTLRGTPRKAEGGAANAEVSIAALPIRRPSASARLKARTGLPRPTPLLPRPPDPERIVQGTRHLRPTCSMARPRSASGIGPRTAR